MTVESCPKCVEAVWKRAVSDCVSRYSRISDKRRRKLRINCKAPAYEKPGLRSMFTIRGLFQDFQQFGQQAGNRILVLCRVEDAVDDGFFVRSDTAFDDRFEERMQGHPSALCDAEVVEEQCCGAMPCDRFPWAAKF